MPRLKRTLLADGVLYPVGTAKSDIKADVQAEDVWDEGPDDKADKPKAPARRSRKSEDD